MSKKSKGINAERELIHLFWGKGIPAIRVAGSGSSKYPSPDIIAGNVSRKFAIECKSIKTDSKYIPKKEIEQLKEFSSAFGCEAWIGIRFQKEEWFFLPLEDLIETKESYAMNLVSARLKGLLFEELIL